MSEGIKPYIIRMDGRAREGLSTSSETNIGSELRMREQKSTNAEVGPFSLLRISQVTPFLQSINHESITVLFYVCSHQGDRQKIKQTHTIFYIFFFYIILAYPQDYEQSV